MERCKTLINRLREQCEDNADPATMMITVQLLEAELANMLADKPAVKAGSGVSVVLPGFSKRFQPAEPKEDLAVTLEQDLIKIPEDKMEALPEGIIYPVAEQPGNKEVWVLDPILETPTLAHQDEIKELNEKMGKLSGESLNDKLKTVRTDISSFLTETPVKELKKAIGVNDRFLFVGELFRGDIDMYERSIKTINNFRILAEAEYWIERELKIKLGWDSSGETVKQFYQLVKRRFS
ncbi:MAG: hypothetical protein H7Y03_09385 [Chitinophagaceae bacterium]|nr:hypothetical protein [Chitinophagaceae bacterium]